MKGSLILAHLDGLEMADPNFMDRGHIDLLLRASVHARIIDGQVIKGESDEPIATSSSIGWLISGDVCSAISGFSCQIAVMNSVEEVPLDNLLQRFWQIEEMPSSNNYTADEQACERHFIETHSRDSRQRDAKLKEAYVEFMGEFENLGHMASSSQVSIRKSVSESIFLPHHGVWKESSSTTKLRTVFNASSKSRSGISLNDLLLAGPTLLPNLVDLICNWRNYRYAFTADVEKMYRQIWVHPDDQHFQSILWRSSPDFPVEIFRLLTVTYRVVCSTFLSQRKLKQLVIDQGAEYPIGAKILQSEIYMDDVLSGADSLQELEIKRVEITELLQSGGFPLRKWSSNSAEALRNIPQHLLAMDPLLLSDDQSTLAVLGLSWCPVSDCFVYKIDTPKLIEVCTKRAVLSRIARLFDPMGWLAPVIVSAKILMQSLWLLKIGWDDELPEDVTNKWEAWRSQLECLENVKIPRWTYFTPSAEVIEVHGFADASKFAYAAVIYLRVIQNDQVTLSLLLAKTRVAPLKTLSIPRLELSGAHLLAKLTSHFVQTSTFRIDGLHLWSDSSDVLCWLKDRPSRWPVFVANRCAEIITILPNAYWHKVRSRDNPADAASRGIEPTRMRELPLWWNGPSWLSAEPVPWSTSSAISVAENPVHRLVNLNLNVSSGSKNTHGSTEPWDLVERFSSLQKLLRITAYCLRFVIKLSNCCLRKNALAFKLKLLSLEFWEDTGDLSVLYPSVKELKNSRLWWVHRYQTAYFAEEISCLSKNKPLNTRSSILKLNPILNKGLLCVGGRLRNSLLDDESKQPLIVPPGSLLTTLLVRHTHLLTLHGGVQLTLVTLRRQYWIIRGRQSVKSIIGKCVTCLRYTATTNSQRMGDLPEVRVTPSFPFNRSGVDYAGPFKVRLSKTRGKGTMKGYIAVFICLATRAVHLEIVEDYYSEAFVNAFHRFTSRRGHCSLLLSDQGTTFVGADAILREMFRNSSQYFKQNALTLANLGTTWRFNPGDLIPAAPHFGGVWESAVKSTKYHLKRVIVPEEDLSTSKVSLGKRWELLTQMTQTFWKRWSTEYLSSLQERHKWKYASRSNNVGDIVLIKNGNFPPGQWPLGRIISTHPGTDGLVRVATVKTATSIIQRPICKLVTLQAAEEESLSVQL